MSTTTMDAKTAILARARDAISRSQQGRPVRPIPRDYIRSTEHAPGSQAVIDEMIEKLEDYSAKVVVVSKESEVADAISTFLADQKATSVVVPTGLDEAFKKAAARDGRTVREDSREQAIPTLELDEIDAVVTRCRVAISILRHHRSRRRARPGSTRDLARARHPRRRPQGRRHRPHGPPGGGHPQ